MSEKGDRVDAAFGEFFDRAAQTATMPSWQKLFVLNRADAIEGMRIARLAALAEAAKTCDEIAAELRGRARAVREDHETSQTLDAKADTAEYVGAIITRLGAAAAGEGRG